MKPTFLAALAALALSGCTTTNLKDSSHSFTWKAPSGKSYAVSGDIDRIRDFNGLTTKHSARLSVFFNGKPAITGDLHGKTYGGTASGEFDGMQLSSSCVSSPRSPSWIEVNCDIAADGSTIGTLRF